MLLAGLCFAFSIASGQDQVPPSPTRADLEKALHLYEGLWKGSIDLTSYYGELIVSMEVEKDYRLVKENNDPTLYGRFLFGTLGSLKLSKSITTIRGDKLVNSISQEDGVVTYIGTLEGERISWKESGKPDSESTTYYDRFMERGDDRIMLTQSRNVIKSNDDESVTVFTAGRFTYSAEPSNEPIETWYNKALPGVPLVNEPSIPSTNVSPAVESKSVTKANAEITKLQTELGQREQEIAQLKNRLAQITKESSVYTVEQSAVVDNLKQQLSSRNSELETLQAALQKATDEASKANQSLEEMASLKEDLEIAQANATDFEAKYMTAREALNEGAESNREITSNLQEQLNSTKQSLQRTREQLKESQMKLTEAERLKSVLTEREQEIASLQTSFANLQQQARATSQQNTEAVQKLQQQLATRQKDLESVQATLKDSEKESMRIDEAMTEVATLQQNLNEARANAKALQGKLESTEGTLSQTQNKLADAESQMTEMQSERQTLSAQISTLESISEENEALTLQVAEMQSANQSLVQQIIDAESEKEQLQSTLIAEVQSAIGERDAARGLTDELTQELGKAREQITVARASLDETEAELVKQLSSSENLVEELSKLRRDKNSRINERLEMGTTITEQKETIAGLRLELESSQVAISEMKSRIDNLTKDLSEKSDILAANLELEGANKQLEQQLSDSRQETDAAKNSTAESNNELMAVRNELLSEQNRATELQNRIAAAASDAVTLRDELTLAEAKIKAQAEQYSSLEEVAATAQNEAKLANTQLDEIRKQLTTEQALTENLTERLEGLQETYNQLVDDAGDATSKLDEQNLLAQQQAEQITALRQELESSNVALKALEGMDELSAKASQLSQRVSSLEAELAESTSERQKAEAVIRERVETIAVLQNEKDSLTQALTDTQDSLTALKRKSLADEKAMLASNESNAAKIAQMESQLSSRSEELLNAQSELQQRQERIAALQAKLTASDGSLKSLQTETESLRSQLAQLSAKDSDLLEVTTQLDKTRVELATVQASLEEREKQLATTQGTNQQLVAQLAVRDDSLTSSMGANKALQGENETLRQRLATLQKLTAEKDSELVIASQELEKARGRLQEFAAVEAEAGRLRGQISELSKSNEKAEMLVVALERLRTQVKEQDQELLSLQNSNEALIAQRDAANQTVDELQPLQQELASMLAQNRNLAGVNAQLMDDVSELRNEREQWLVLERQLKAQTAESDKLITMVEQRNSEVSKLREAVATLRNSTKSLQAQNARLSQTQERIRALEIERVGLLAKVDRGSRQLRANDEMEDRIRQLERLVARQESALGTMQERLAAKGTPVTQEAIIINNSPVKVTRGLQPVPARILDGSVAEREAALERAKRMAAIEAAKDLPDDGVDQVVFESPVTERPSSSGLDLFEGIEVDTLEEQPTIIEVTSIDRPLPVTVSRPESIPENLPVWARSEYLARYPHLNSQPQRPATVALASDSDEIVVDYSVSKPKVIIPEPTPEPRKSAFRLYRNHRVAIGETLQSICRSYGASLKETIVLNGLDEARDIKPGQILLIRSISEAS